MAKKPISRAQRRATSPGSRIDPELVDKLLADYKKPEDLLGEGGLLKELTAALVNRALQAELDEHLGYEPGARAPEEQTNRRNGKGTKRLRSDQGVLDIEVPRDREGSFEPQLVPKHQRHFNGFDDKILSMYARGMSVREIRAHLKEIYGVEVSPDLISRATDAVHEELHAWQKRSLSPVYAVVYLDAFVLKIRDKGFVQNKAAYLAVGVNLEGEKEVLGVWLERTEGAKFWLAILSELKQRGLEDVFVLCADGLKGLPQAVEATFPLTIFQTCLVHVVRSSTRYVPWKQRKALCRDLREVYTALDEEGALRALERFEKAWGAKFPMIAPAWRARWDEITPFLAFPPEIRRVIYTTNAIEALNRQLRKIFKTRGHMPTDEAALKLLYLAIRNAEVGWGQNRNTWGRQRLQFAIHFADRMPK